MDISSVDLTVELKKILDEYGDSVTNIMNEEVEKIGKDAKRKITKESKGQISGNKYSRSFAVKVNSMLGGLYKEVILYNKKAGLTHLLEKGHPIVRNGHTVGQASARPHFLPVQEWLEEELPKRITQRIKRNK